MKRALKIIVPVLLVIAVLSSIGWYLLKYDRNFTRDMLVSYARWQQEQGNHSVAAWLYDFAYQQSNKDEDVAIELSELFKTFGNYTKAEYTLSHAISDGGSADLYIALCKTYVEQDKLLDAVTMLDNIADPAIKAQLDAQRPKAPVADPESGYYNQYISVSLNAPDGTVYMTTNGEYPSTADEPYSEPIALSGGETTIYALTVGENGLVSPVTILGYTIGGVIEEVTLSDPAIDRVVRQQLQVSEEHTLYSDELWSITSLIIPKDAETLEDLSWMPFMESLVIRNSQFESLSFLSSLTSLQELVIADTVVGAEDLQTIASLPNLTSLSMTGCSLSSISELSAATGLTYLDLRNNTIRDLSALTSMPDLEYVDLSHNAVKELDALSGLTKLTELDISYNSITSTAHLSGCTALNLLDISGNFLKRIEGLDQIPGLRSLFLAYNQLTDVTGLSANSTLGELDVSNNSLTDISALGALNNLMILNFSYNQVEKLPKFSTDCALVTIKGSQNLLTSLEELKGLENLNYVIMDHNKGIKSIKPLTDCRQLVEVSVYGTSVTDASPLTDLKVIVKYTPI